MIVIVIVSISYNKINIFNTGIHITSIISHYMYPNVKQPNYFTCTLKLYYFYIKSKYPYLFIIFISPVTAVTAVTTDKNNNVIILNAFS